MVNTSTSLQTLRTALGAMPGEFRDKLLDNYNQSKVAFSRRQFETCILKAGKFCEILLRFLQHELTGSHVPFGRKIPNFASACQSLETTSQTAGHESLRILIPRAMNFVYSIRNKRDVGHVGGDVDSNAIDAATAVRNIDWCLAELVRIFHRLSLEEAQEVLDAVSYRELPIVWAIGGTKRVLDPSMKLSEQTLVLLYGDTATAVPVEDLGSWVEASRIDNFRNQVLVPLHKRRLVEYDRETQTVMLSPTGAARAEEIVLASTLTPA